MLEQLTSSPYFYHYLYLVVLALTVFNISEIAVLLVHKRRVERDDAERERLKHMTAAALITAPDPASALPRPATDNEYAAYSEAVASILESFEGEVAARAAKLIRDFGIDQHYRQAARGPVWYKRAGAVDILSSFKLKENREFFLAFFRSETSAAVKYRVLYGLSLLVRDRADIYALARLLSTLPYLTAKYTEDLFFNIISSLKALGREEEFGQFLVKILTDADVLVLVKRDCLSACHAAACEHAGGVVKRYYAAYPDEPEILIACIKSLARMGDFGVLPEALRHPDWRVRLNALKFAHLCGAEILPDLRGLLHDRNYHIRVYAAQALTKFGGAGMEILRAETSSSDKFAADAAGYALTLAGGRA